MGEDGRGRVADLTAVDDDDEVSAVGPSAQAQLTDDARVEVGEPFCLEGGEWICVAKLMGREDEIEQPGPPHDGTAVTHTMFLAQGFGRSAEEATREALRQIEQVRGVPNPEIRRRSSAPPPSRGSDAATVPPPSSGTQERIVVESTPPAAASSARPAASWLSRLLGRR